MKQLINSHKNFPKVHKSKLKTIRQTPYFTLRYDCSHHTHTDILTIPKSVTNFFFGTHHPTTYSHPLCHARRYWLYHALPTHTHHVGVTHSRHTRHTRLTHSRHTRLTHSRHTRPLPDMSVTPGIMVEPGMR